MNADSIIQELEALISARLKIASRHNLETIEITTPRARMLMHDILAYKKEKSRTASKHVKKEPAWLDEKWI
jgi:vacuolar-type H+-ATPase subunit H